MDPIPDNRQFDLRFFADLANANIQQATQLERIADVLESLLKKIPE